MALFNACVPGSGVCSGMMLFGDHYRDQPVMGAHWDSRGSVRGLRGMGYPARSALFRTGTFAENPPVAEDRGRLARQESPHLGSWSGVCFAGIPFAVCFGGCASMWGACCRVWGTAWEAAGELRQMAPTRSRIVRGDSAEGLSGPTGGMWLPVGILLYYPSRPILDI